MLHRRNIVAPRLVVAILVGTVALAAVACTQPAATPTKAPAPTVAPTAAPQPPTAAPVKPTAAPAAPTAVPKAKIDFPTRPITVVVPFAAGGGLDVGARIAGSFLEKELAQPIQVVNKPGATGQIGWTEVTQSKPDGYTLTVLSSPNTEATYVDPKRKAAYGRTSFAPIANQVYDPNVYVVKSDSPYKSMADVIKAVKEKPESITSGDGGLMSDDHLSLLVFQKLTGATFAMSHFDGSAPAKTALHGGHTGLLIDNMGGVMPEFKSGAFRVLGIAAAERSKLMPEVPTLKEQGIDLVTAVARGWAAPAGTPQEVIKVLEGALKKADAMPDYVDKMTTAGLPTKFMNAEEYDKYLQAEEKRVSDLTKEFNP